MGIKKNIYQHLLPRRHLGSVNWNVIPVEKKVYGKSPLENPEILNILQCLIENEKYIKEFYENRP